MKYYHNAETQQTIVISDANAPDDEVAQQFISLTLQLTGNWINLETLDSSGI